MEEIEIPKEILVIAVPASWIDFFDVNFKGEPIIILKNRKIELEGGSTIKLIPRGAFKIKPGYVRTVKYLVIDARKEKIELGGSIVLERTNEVIDDTPVFRVTNKEPQAFLYGIFYRNLDDCKELEILRTENVIKYYKSCRSDDDSVSIAIDLILPVDKTALVEYSIEGRKHKVLILWNNGDPVDLLDIYEEPRQEEIL